MSRYLFLLGPLVMAFGCVQLQPAAAPAGGRQLSGYIGAHPLAFVIQTIRSEATYALAGQPDYLAVTEVYPDVPVTVQYRYSLRLEGLGSYARCQTSKGFGPTTYFIRTGQHPVGKVSILAGANSSRHPVSLAAVRGLHASELQELLDADDFSIMGLIPAHLGPAERDRLARQLSEQLGSRPEYHISKGVSAEIFYASRDTAGVRDQLLAWQSVARQYHLPVMLGLVSWWAGTPLAVPDGRGGAFGDITYQQICYAPDLELPESPVLRALLGDRYDRHYLLTIPNQWSNTPWLTMNNDVLNRYRYQRLDEVVGQLREVCAGDASWLHAVFLENEPRYWDTQCDEQGRNLWADFNPGTVAAARQAGVELNPVDGLDPAELAWLFRNVGRYNQETVNCVARALSRQMPALDLPVYTHALEYPDFTFPGKPLNHTQSEWAYANGARTGIEGALNMPGDFNRVREWGRWANVNREEGGWPADLSLWDLRISYMMGADLYNSYNWHSSSNRLAYVEEFLRELPVVRLPPARAECTATNQIRIATPMKLQAFTRVELPVEVRETFKGRLTLVVADAVRTHTAVNLARGAKVSASSVDSADGYSVARVNDGDASTVGGPTRSWTNDANAPMPQWVELDFGAARTFNTVEVLTSEGYELRDFQVQYRSSTDWLAAGEPVADNTEVQRTITFATVTASRLRIACNRGPACQPEFVRVNEVEVYNEVEPQASRGDFCPSLPATVDLAPGRHVVAFDFPTPAESRYQRRALLTLSCEPDGAAGAGAVALSADSATGLMLALDLRAQRALSLWVIKGAWR
jgi:hypothetical protein